MVRRRWQLDPELAPVARERLRRVLGREPVQENWFDDPVPRSSLGADPSATGHDHLDDVPVGLDDLAPPRHFSRWHLGVVSALVLVGLLWGGWSLLRSRPVALAAPAAPAAVQTVSPGSAPPSAASSTSAATPGSTATPSADVVVVHVLGAVHRPGLVRLPDHARVQDAIEAAGGLTRDADPAELNLAQPLADGEQVLIGTTKHAAGEVRDGTTSGGTSSGGGGSSGSGTSGSSAGSGAVVDLNRATQAQLEDLPGVGPVTAQKIIAWRTEHGRFSRVEEMQEVDGIGPKTFAQIAPHVRV